MGLLGSDAEPATRHTASTQEWGKFASFFLCVKIRKLSLQGAFPLDSAGGKASDPNYSPILAILGVINPFIPLGYARDDDDDDDDDDGDNDVTVTSHNVRVPVTQPASARGIGICVINKWKDVPKQRPIIVQQYISRPLLINRNKFDLRLYVYVTSFDPLRLYIYDDGLARFASSK